MSDTISLEFIGATLRTIQAEQRTQRMEVALLREQIARMATKAELLDVLNVLAERFGNFEALMETRFDRLEGRFDQLATQVAGIAR